jgi:hypothetical protein
MDTKDNTNGSDRPAGSGHNAFRSQAAPVLATAALLLAIAGVVYGPDFAREGSIDSSAVQAQGVSTTTAVALRQ